MSLRRALLHVVAGVSVVAGLGLPGIASASGRHNVIANVDLGGGVLLANRPGGFYMGRLFPNWTFDRHGSWYTSAENGSSYAWSFAWGHSNSCLWVGPSRGKLNYTAGTWASSVQSGFPDRCSDAQRAWLGDNNGVNIGSHFNCQPGTAAHGTQKQLLVQAPFYWNLEWGGATGYDGGTRQDFVTHVAAGTSVWYRYTTRDGNNIVAFVPGIGWGFFPIGVLDRSYTGYWSDPNTPGSLISCPR